jgi:hypothetical protein
MARYIGIIIVSSAAIMVGNQFAYYSAQIEQRFPIK